MQTHSVKFTCLSTTVIVFTGSDQGVKVHFGLIMQQTAPSAAFRVLPIVADDRSASMTDDENH